MIVDLFFLDFLILSVLSNAGFKQLNQTILNKFI